MKIKLLSIATVFGLLLLALIQISQVVHDRQSNREYAVRGVAGSLAGAQTLLGPLIHMQCTEDVVVIEDKKSRIEKRQVTLAYTPKLLKIDGVSQLEPRGRGLHSTQVFNLKAKITAQWPNLAEELKVQAPRLGGRAVCDEPVLMLAVSDARGIRQARITLAGQALEPEPGTHFDAFPRGVHATVPKNVASSSNVQADIDLELVGTQSIALVPLGSETEMKLTSNWPHPSFGGRFLPVEHHITDDGFEAQWRVSSLASTTQQDLIANKRGCSGSSSNYNEGDSNGDSESSGAQNCMETLSVGFVDPSDTYALSDRATKYGLLFIGLTFLAVGLFEFMKSLRVHPIQYGLVGAAMTLFFLLLVSLSEHLPFTSAYALAATACVLLLTFYASHMLGGWGRSVPFGLGIALLYALLFVLLRIEQTALLVGAVALFGALAATMALTRRIDWYARLKQMQAPAPVTAPATAPSAAVPASAATPAPAAETEAAAQALAQTLQRQADNPARFTS